MVLYHYDSNRIIFRLIKNISGIEEMRVYGDMYMYLKARNCKTKLNIMDNEASKAANRYITNANINYQLVEPTNHCVNASERTIRMLKTHFVAGLSSVHPKFPIYLWDELRPQSFITFKLLQTSRTCPKIYAYAHLNGTYNLDTTPISPPGVRALLYNDPNHRVSYGVHDDEAYYLGPSLEHYHCYTFFSRIQGESESVLLHIFFQQMSQHQCYCQLLKY